MFWRKKKNNVNHNIGDLTITDYLTDGLLIFDSENKVILANPRVERFFEVREEDILDKSILDLSRFKDFKPVVTFLGGGIKECYREDLKIRENFILQVTSVPVKNDGEKISTLVILHDVTRERLSDQMKSEFVTLAAHQLRTPTSAVKWSLQSLMSGDLGTLNAEQKKAIETAYITNDRVISLVRDLLDLAQIEEGKYISKTELADIEEIIQSVINENKQIIANRKLRVEFKRSETPLPKLMLDKEKIKIAIGNIFDNALRYTLAGGKVTISSFGSKKQVQVEVKDTGLGIPSDEQERVFTKFFRAENIRKMDTEGTGLGLYIAKNIIEAHEGKIWFNSEENKGTTFYFTIPVKERFGQFLREDLY